MRRGPLAGMPLYGSQPVVLEGFLDAPGAGGADALVDAEGLPQVDSGLAGVAIYEADLAESFEGAGLLQGCADAAGDLECRRVMFAGLAGG